MSVLSRKGLGELAVRERRRQQSTIVSVVCDRKAGWRDKISSKRHNSYSRLDWWCSVRNALDTTSLVFIQQVLKA